MIKPKQIVNKLIWFKGEIIPQAEAKINIMTTTAQYGINVFEGVRCYYSAFKKQLYAFRLNDHLERLYNSAKLLRFQLGNNHAYDNMLSYIKEIICANNYREDIYIKIGFFLDGEGSWSGIGPISAFILPMPKGRMFEDKTGVNCCVVSWGRINETAIPPRIKAGANYINSRFAHHEAIRNNYDMAIFMGVNGKIAEGTGACIFMVKKGKLITPSVTNSILESITRETIIEIAKKEMNMIVEEREIDRTELYLSDELFFTGTTVEILPIVSVDKIKINDGTVGKTTKNLKKLFFQTALCKMEKYKDWLTPIYRK